MFSTEKASHSKRDANRPWVEKYRPKSVDDVVEQDEVVEVLRKSLKGSELPNLLLYGPPGTGKTSTILAAAKQLFGDIYRDRVLELNASDERGISVVRDKIKSFAQLTASSHRPDGRSCPSFKLIVLDEADSMTKDAQSALRRTMELQSRSTRFCLICNYVSRIIEPITSRCAKFRFKPLHADIMIHRLRYICSNEGVQCDDKTLQFLCDSSDGDLRRCIMTLQSCAGLKSEISVGDVMEVTGRVPDDIITNLLMSCKNGNFDRMKENVTCLLLDGFSANQTLHQLHGVILPSDELTDFNKSLILERFAIIDKRLMDGGDEFLQILDACTMILKTFTSTS